jgi:ParB family chromosome partitioning protein
MELCSQVLVRPLASGRFQLIAGERRWRASQQAGKATIPAILRQVSDEQAMEITIVENLQRADLNPMEQARAFRAALARVPHDPGADGRAHRQGSRHGCQLPAPAAAAGLGASRVESGELSFGHARTLLAFEHAEEIEKAAQRIGALSLSVRQTETMYKASFIRKRLQKRSLNQSLRSIQTSGKSRSGCSEPLDLKVHIEDHNGRGKVIIEYARLEDFDTFLEQLAGNKSQVIGRLV